MKEENNDAFCLEKEAAVICIFTAQETKQKAKYWAEETCGRLIQFPHLLIYFNIKSTTDMIKIMS